MTRTFSAVAGYPIRFLKVPIVIYMYRKTRVRIPKNQARSLVLSLSRSFKLGYGKTPPSPPKSFGTLCTTYWHTTQRSGNHHLSPLPSLRSTSRLLYRKSTSKHISLSPFLVACVDLLGGHSTSEELDDVGVVRRTGREIKRREAEIRDSPHVCPVPEQDLHRVREQ